MAELETCNIVYFLTSASSHNLLFVCALYFSLHFILVENIYASHSEGKGLCLPLKFCQNVSEGNQSIDFNKEKSCLRNFKFSL